MNGNKDPSHQKIGHLQSFHIDCSELLRHVQETPPCIDSSKFQKDLQEHGDQHVDPKRNIIPNLNMAQLPLDPISTPNINHNPYSIAFVSSPSKLYHKSDTNPQPLLQRSYSATVATSLSPHHTRPRRNSSRSSTTTSFNNSPNRKRTDPLNQSSIHVAKRVEEIEKKIQSQHQQCTHSFLSTSNLHTHEIQNETNKYYNPMDSGKDDTVAQAEEHEQDEEKEEWYLLVASTPYAVSAQLVCTATWCRNKHEVGNENQDTKEPRSTVTLIKPDPNLFPPMKVWSYEPLMNEMETSKDIETLSTFNCSILFMDPLPHVSKESDHNEQVGEDDGHDFNKVDMDHPILHIAIAMGTNQNRVLSFQLSIHKNEYYSSSLVTAIYSPTSSPIKRPVHNPKISPWQRLNRQYSTSSEENNKSFDNSDDISMTSKSSLPQSQLLYILRKSHDPTRTCVEPLPLLPSIVKGSNQAQSDTVQQQQQLHRDSSSNIIFSPSTTQPMVGSSLYTTPSLIKERASNSASSNQDRRLSKDMKENSFGYFHPNGGVTSIHLYYCRPILPEYGYGTAHPSHSKSRRRFDSFLWITYADGTIVRLPNHAFFSLESENIFHASTLSPSETKTMEHMRAFGHEYLQSHGADKFAFARVIAPPSLHSANGDSIKQVIIPCPKSFPTIMSQPFDLVNSSFEYLEEDDASNYSNSKDNCHRNSMNSIGNTDSVGSMDDDYDFVHPHEFFEAISYCKDTGAVGENHAPFPMLSFYTSENQMYSQQYISNPDSSADHSSMNLDGVDSLFNMVKATSSTIIGGTASLAKGVWGGVMGKFLSNNQSTNLSPDGVMVRNSDHRRQTSVNAHETALHSSASTDGNFAADQTFSPSLPYREPVELPLGLAMFDSPRKVIHISIDPVHGTLAACADNLGRVQLVDLSIKQVVRLWKGVRDASCHWMALPGSDLSCSLYLLIHSRQRKVVEVYKVRHGPRQCVVQADDHDARVIESYFIGSKGEVFMKSFLYLPSHSRIESIMLSPKSLISTSSRNSNRATEESSLKLPYKYRTDDSMQLQLLRQLLSSDQHLPSALDTIFMALTELTALSDLVKAIDILATATILEEYLGVDGSSFHAEVVDHAERLLNEIKNDDATTISCNHFVVDLSMKIQYHKQLILAYDTLSEFEKADLDRGSLDWSTDEKVPREDETQSWIKIYEQISGASVDTDLYPEDGHPLKFSTFAKACLHCNKGEKSDIFCHEKLKIYFCDSSKERKGILTHIFRPLLTDVFSLKVVREVFEHMGIHQDYDLMYTYFGEWFMTVRLHQVDLKKLYGPRSPPVRFLENLIQGELDFVEAQQTEVTILKTLFSFIAQASDLVRCHLLARTCLHSIASMSKQLEEKTYGMISKELCVIPWDNLVSKIDICLLIALRLYGSPLGSFPLTVQNVEDGKIFSVYDWIARDELKGSHRQEELLSLERVCMTLDINGYDKAGRLKLMQQSCLEERSHLSPLLFFLRHYNNKYYLAAHRALNLAGMWARMPESLDLLTDCMNCIRILDSRKNVHLHLASLIRIEIWQIYLRPMFRAILFGFNDVHELSEEQMAHLFSNREWLHEIFRLSIDLLNMLDKTFSLRQVESSSSDCTFASPAGSVMWPPLRDDIIIQGLVNKSRSLNRKSVQIHCGVICALHLSRDFNLIETCFPNLESMFLSISLFQDVFFEKSLDNEKNRFIADSLRLKAEASDLGLDEAIVLGKLFGLPKDRILTTFIVCMYEVGKDDEVDDLVTASSRLLDVAVFLSGCINIVAVRLYSVLSIIKKEKRYRGVLAMLDADCCEWVHETSKEALLRRPGKIHVGDNVLQILYSSNALMQKMLRLNSPNRRDQIHSMSVLIGILIQAWQENKESTLRKM